MDLKSEIRIKTAAVIDGTDGWTSSYDSNTPSGRLAEGVLIQRAQTILLYLHN